jgi:hypothetical protein
MTAIFALRKTSGKIWKFSASRTDRGRISWSSKAAVMAYLGLVGRVAIKP